MAGKWKAAAHSALKKRDEEETVMLPPTDNDVSEDATVLAPLVSEGISVSESGVTDDGQHFILPSAEAVHRSFRIGGRAAEEATNEAHGTDRPRAVEGAPSAWMDARGDIHRRMAAPIQEADAECDGTTLVPPPLPSRERWGSVSQPIVIADEQLKTNAVSEPGRADSLDEAGASENISETPDEMDESAEGQNADETRSSAATPALRGRLRRLQKKYGVFLLALAVAAIFIASKYAGAEIAMPPEPVSDSAASSGVIDFPELELESTGPVSAEDVRRQLESQSKPVDTEGLSEKEKTKRKFEALAKLGDEYAAASDIPLYINPNNDAPRARKVLSNRRARRPRKKPKKLRDEKWFRPGGTLKLKGKAKKNEERRLRLPIGTRLFAELEVGVSSIRGGEVLAKLTKPLRHRGEVLLRKGTYLKGSATAGDERLYLKFSQAHATTGEIYAFAGYAVQRDVRGVVARRREASFSERGKSGIARESITVAREVAESVADATIAGRVVKGVARGVAPEAQREVEIEHDYVLEVAAGSEFEIVVSSGAS